ncbi:MAG: biotin--[acetyl-CoA-carboxylase] ligase [Myxococcota bacterium]
MNDAFDPERLTQLLAGAPWGESLDVKATTESTMDDAAKAAADGAPDGHVVLADAQTRGRGAHGRQWVSPAGSDLYFSVVARPNVEAADTALVTLAVGLGVCDVAAALAAGGDARVKWPNDVWLDGKKCAGILVESRTMGSKIDAVIVGVGLNVNRLEWPVELAGLATSLRAERPSDDPLDREQVFAQTLTSMHGWVQRLVRDGAKVIVDALEPRLAMVGDQVRWQDGAGTFLGIDAHGAARVATPDGELQLRAAHLERVDA